jgi:hypothetical protein
MSIQSNQLRRRIWIDQTGRDGLARILDVVLPGTDTLPSGRTIGAHEALLDLVIDADPRLEAPLTAAGVVAAQAPAADADTLTDIDAWAGEHVEEVVFALNAAYYMSAQVRELIGYPGQKRRPIASATPEEVCSDELVAPVLERGPIFVPTPD